MILFGVRSPSRTLVRLRRVARSIAAYQAAASARVRVPMRTSAECKLLAYRFILAAVIFLLFGLRTATQSGVLEFVLIASAAIFLLGAAALGMKALAINPKSTFHGDILERF